MKKNKITGVALALTLTAIPGIETFVPFAPSSTAVEVSASESVDEFCECMVTTLNTGLNLRKSPDTDSKVITTIPRFAIVRVEGKVKNGWIKVSYKKNTGYVSANYLAGVYHTCTCTITTQNVTTGLNLRLGPGTKYDVITSIPKGAKFKKCKIDVNGFEKVTYNGYTGWVSADYTTSCNKHWRVM